MADAERRAGETAPADRAPRWACPGRWSPSADYLAAAGFFTSLALGFLAAAFGSFRSTVLRSSWWLGPPPFDMITHPLSLDLERGVRRPCDNISAIMWRSGLCGHEAIQVQKHRICRMRSVLLAIVSP